MKSAQSRQALVVLAAIFGSVIGLFQNTTAWGDPPAAAPAVTRILVIDSVEPVQERDCEGGLLVREIVRQAIWIAAEERGILLRDASLREPVTSEKLQVVRIRPEIKVHVGKAASIRLLSGSNKDSQEIWKADIPLSPKNPIDYTELITKMEEASRNGFVEALGAAGFGDVTVRKTSDAALPKKIDEGLGDASAISQFNCLRQLHSIILKKGYSPQLVGGLVRGYANLAELTRFFWNATPDVFMARSLLYAERLVQADPNSVLPHWHRAYARAIVGLHGAAMDELGEIKKLTPQKGSEAGDGQKPSADSDLPSWSKLVDPVCRYKTSALYSIGQRNKSLQSLACLLAMATLEHSDAHEKTLNAATRVLDLREDCYRAYDVMCVVGGVSNLHRATSLGPEVLGLTLADRLGMVTGIPAKVLSSAKIDPEKAKNKQLAEALKSLDSDDDQIVSLGDLEIADACAAVPATVKALVDATSNGSDKGQPTWSTLGRMLEETLFVQVYRRAAFMKEDWGVPVDEFVARSAPLVKRHPYSGLITSFGALSASDAKDRYELLVQVKVVDSNYNVVRAFRRNLLEMGEKGRPTADKIWRDAVYHGDSIAFDACQRILQNKPQSRPPHARSLIEISPQCPIAFATLISSDWDNVKKNVPAWEKRYGHHAALAAALARQYSAQSQWGDAERCLRAYLKESPDLWAFNLLAENYLKQKNREKWKETLEEFLKHDDRGLGHADVQRKLADYLMSEKKWKEALPYAESAAESGAAWAMECALRCHEGLQEWDKAEEWAKQIGERYDGLKFKWYNWCKRTQHGHLEDARKYSRAAAETAATSGASAELLRPAAVFYLLENKPKRALTLFQEAYAESNDILIGLHVAAVADSLKESTTRDAMLNQICAKDPNRVGKDQKVLFELAKLMKAQLAGGSRLTIDTVEKLVSPGGTGVVPNVWYFAGQFLDCRGQKDVAKECFMRSATWSGATYSTQLIAIESLRGRGVKVPHTVPSAND